MRITAFIFIYSEWVVKKFRAIQNVSADQLHKQLHKKLALRAWLDSIFPVRMWVPVLSSWMDRKWVHLPPEFVLRYNYLYSTVSRGNNHTPKSDHKERIMSLKSAEHLLLSKSHLFGIRSRNVKNTQRNRIPTIEMNESQLCAVSQLSNLYFSQFHSSHNFQYLQHNHELHLDAPTYKHIPRFTRQRKH